MNKAKKTFDLGRFAAEAKNDAAESILPIPTKMEQTPIQPFSQPSSDERLQKLLASVGKTVILPPEWLTIEDNVRQILDTTSDDFERLVENIRQRRVRQNLIGDLRVAENGDWRIICVSGQRRLLAAIRAKEKSVPVKLEQYSDEATLVLDSLSENIHRKPLHTLDVALGYLRLHKLNFAPESIAEYFEKEKDTVMKMLRLARYPEEAHAVIRAHPEKFTSTVLITKFVAKKWKDTETLVSALKNFANNEQKRSSQNKPVDHALKEIESRFSERGLKAKSRGSKENGKITLTWSSQEAFNQIENMLSSFESDGR